MRKCRGGEEERPTHRHGEQQCWILSSASSVETPGQTPDAALDYRVSRPPVSKGPCWWARWTITISSRVAISTILGWVGEWEWGGNGGRGGICGKWATVEIDINPGWSPRAAFQLQTETCARNPPVLSTLFGVEEQRRTNSAECLLTTGATLGPGLTPSLGSQTLTPLSQPENTHRQRDARLKATWRQGPAMPGPRRIELEAQLARMESPQGFKRSRWWAPCGDRRDGRQRAHWPQHNGQANPCSSWLDLARAREGRSLRGSLGGSSLGGPGLSASREMTLRGSLQRHQPREWAMMDPTMAMCRGRVDPIRNGMRGPASGCSGCAQSLHLRRNLPQTWTETLLPETWELGGVDDSRACCGLGDFCSERGHGSAARCLGATAGLH